MKKIKTAFMLILALVVMSQTVYAHSGRTDSNGGHKDNKNKSGLGGYHYHCGGYPAHLHPNGVCPYKSAALSNSKKVASTTYTSSKSTPSGSSSVSSYQSVYESDYFELSNIRTFINGYEIPTFSHSKLGGGYIIAEDLKDYGFETSWNGETNILTIVKSNGKELNPLPMDYYRGFGVGYKFFDIASSNPVKILFKNSADEVGYYPFAYSCNGYMAVSIDELKAFTENWTWNGDNLSMTFNMR